MTTLTWSDQLTLQQPQVDATHGEFVALLAQTEAALSDNEADLLTRFDTVQAYTALHFAQEDRWMAATGLAPVTGKAEIVIADAAPVFAKVTGCGPVACTGSAPA